MKLAPLRSLAPWALVLCIFCPASAIAENVTEIQLGSPPPPERPVDPARVSAVERFLAARQAGGAGAARSLLHTKGRLDDATVFGSIGASLAAFQFHDESIASEGEGRFRVSVFLLFADDAGQVVESRDEDLTFSRNGDGYACTSLHPTNTIVWTEQRVREEAAALGSADELEQARRYVLEGGAQEGKRSSYSMADIQRNADGAIVVQCLRFLSSPGKRGFEVRTTPIVFSREHDVMGIVPN
jgi:hypothetical protein